MDGHASMFSDLHDNLQLVIDQLKEGESSRPEADTFALDEFWSRINTFVGGLSAEATKLCLAFSSPPPPSPKDCQPLVEGMEKVTLAIVSAYYSLPKSQGASLQRCVRDAVVGIMQSVQSLANIINTEGCQGAKSQLQMMGGVWEKCDQFRSLPQNNQAAVLQSCREVSDLVKDALEEIEEATSAPECDEGGIAGEDEDEDESAEETWTPADRQLLPPAVGLIKASKACLKKITIAVKKNGAPCNAKNNQELDCVAQRVQDISPGVDDLAASLYPPVNHTVVMENGDSLVSSLTDLLQSSKSYHITNEDDQTWVEFLLKAVDHNRGKIHEIANG